MGSPEGSYVVPDSAEARWLRAALTGDASQRRRIAHEELAGGPPFQLIPAACAVAGLRLFGAQWDRRVTTVLARRIVEQTPAGASLLPRDVEAVMRGMSGEGELMLAVPGEVLAECILASVFGLADELMLDERGVDALLIEAERELAVAAAVEQPPDADDVPVPDDDRWRRTFEQRLTSGDFVPRAHPVARPPRSFPIEKGLSRLPASKAGRYLRNLLRRDSDSGPQVSEVPNADLLRVARMAFTAAVRLYLHPDPDLAETMALSSFTKANHWLEIDLMKAEYITRTVFGEKLPFDGISGRDVYPSCVFMLRSIIETWDRDDAAICYVLGFAEASVAQQGKILAR